VVEGFIGVIQWLSLVAEKVQAETLRVQVHGKGKKKTSLSSQRMAGEVKDRNIMVVHQ
jgi:hypothetical protein